MTVKDLELIYRGSAKNIYRVDERDIAFRFLDDFSVFDVGRAPDKIPGKAEAICACAVKSFKIAERIGVHTHFVEQMDGTTIRVREAQIITDRHLTLKDENYVVPAEWIYRRMVAGSILRAFQSGAKKPEDYGLPAGVMPKLGTPFPSPVHMFTTKFEKVDREITTEEACAMAGITLKDMDQFWSMIDRLTSAIALTMQQAGFALLDGKLECLIGPDREKMIGDVFGTPDEDRPAIIQPDGEIIHYSKECLRQLYIANGYYEKLQEARKKGEPDPPLPRLSEGEIAEASRRYKAVAKAYAN